MTVMMILLLWACSSTEMEGDAALVEAVRYPSTIAAHASGGARGQGSRLTGGEVQIDGPMGPQAVESVVVRYTNQLAYCYKRNRAKEPSPSTTVTVQFTIQADGTTRDLTSESDQDHPDRMACLEGRFRVMQFGVLAGRPIVRVRYPLHFAPH